MTGEARIVGRTRVYDGWYRLDRLALALPGGVVAERHLLDNGSAVAVLPYDPERRVCLLVSQPRAPVIDAGAPPLLEVIAGGLDGAGAAERIVEEAWEEAGLRLGMLEPVCNIWPMCPVSTERVQLYLAPYSAAQREGPGGGSEPDELIEVHEIGLDALREQALNGALVDAKTLILAQALLLRHPGLWQADGAADPSSALQLGGTPRMTAP
ncbi:NUDIX hydrolase [Croceibacterium mercuriale]|uniref:NUDIX domain-containing protein n=1 Tax=Croceibacterium mercuriale TaxID=1572751 RepID=UPI0006905FC5|nr:NUDIX domain-containing protein [Croceibacterium mercuriale]